jgi:hypothetical protein
MPDMICATDQIDVGEHNDIELHDILMEHRKYLKQLFPFCRHLLSGSSRSITAARLNAINSSSPNHSLLVRFVPSALSLVPSSRLLHTHIQRAENILHTTQCF